MVNSYVVKSLLEKPQDENKFNIPKSNRVVRFFLLGLMYMSHLLNIEALKSFVVLLSVTFSNLQ